MCSEVGSIGVGEATFPSTRGTLAAIGTDGARFLRGSQATIQQGIRINDWLPAPGMPGTPGIDHGFPLSA